MKELYDRTVNFLIIQSQHFPQWHPETQFQKPSQKKPNTGCTEMPFTLNTTLFLWDLKSIAQDESE